MTDNRTNEPTEAMILAALNAYSSKGLEQANIKRPFIDAINLDDWSPQAIARMRAALVAAQGAAPQADSEELAWYKRAAKHSADSMAEARATLQMFADRVDLFVFDELSSVLDDQPLDYETGDVIGEVAQVLPSSGVDEDKLAEVIGKARTTSVRDDDGVKSIVMESNEQIARAVAEWLKGQGRGSEM